MPLPHERGARAYIDPGLNLAPPCGRGVKRLGLGATPGRTFEANRLCADRAICALTFGVP